MKKEDQNIEYKQSWRDEYLKWVCGFANANGGRMLIGVMDDKKGNKVVGVPDWKTLLEIVPNLMRDTMGMIADVNHVKKDGRDIVEIVVPPYPVPISLRGGYYVRRGATNQRLSGPGLESFLLRRRGLHWGNRSFEDIGGNSTRMVVDNASLTLKSTGFGVGVSYKGSGGPGTSMTVRNRATMTLSAMSRFFVGVARYASGKDINSTNCVLNV